MSDWTDAYGSVGEAAAWSIVVQAFREDDLEAANQLAIELGAGGGAVWLFRSIEAEYETRRRSRTIQQEPWLRVEFVEEELGPDIADLAPQAATQCLQTQERLGFSQMPSILITFLTQESNAPWVPGRHGYCEPKNGFFKICLPSYLSQNPGELASAISHEAAHALTHDAANGRMVPWLEEAMSMAMGRELDSRAVRAFANGSWNWLDPPELAAAFREDRESDRGRQIVYRAYQQAGWIGMEIVRRSGENGLGEIARRIGRTGVLSEVLARLRGEGPEAPAIRSVLGMDVKALFAAAKASLAG